MCKLRLILFRYGDILKTLLHWVDRLNEGRLCQLGLMFLRCDCRVVGKVGIHLVHLVVVELIVVLIELSLGPSHRLASLHLWLEIGGHFFLTLLAALVSVGALVS